MTAACDGPAVLIVEDEPATAANLVAHLEAAGYRTLTAENGLAAMEVIRREEPRIIISDWVMPGMDGLELCRSAKSRGPEHLVYFVMLTIRSEKADLLAAFDAGVDDFVAKPYHLGELLARVRAGLRVMSLWQQLAERTWTADSLNAELTRLNARLAEQACTDELTGLLNRRQALARLREHWSISQRYGQPLACLMVDVDHFKRVNDRHGHAVGDEVLRELAQVLVKSVRAPDSVFRFGGEEFLILLPVQTAAGAAICADRCRARVEAHRFACLGGTGQLTVSIGIADRADGMGGPNDLLRAADQAMYAAKKGGRNRAALAGVGA